MSLYRSFLDRLSISAAIMQKRGKKQDKPEKRGGFILFHVFTDIHSNAAVMDIDQKTKEVCKCFEILF